jgi:hypothetical protein
MVLPGSAGSCPDLDRGMNRAVAGAPIEALKRVPLFENLDAAELQSLADVMNEANVRTGAVVTAEGSRSDSSS